jgi:glycosyltransferase involved in cell wall biosynthesis
VVASGTPRRAEADDRDGAALLADQATRAPPPLAAIMSTAMNIGLDVRPSLIRPTGAGSYVLALARHLPLAAPGDRFFLFSASLRDRYPHRDWPANVTVVDRRVPVRALNFAWNRLGWPSLDGLAGAKLDLVHSPHPLVVPSRHARHVITLHDLFFLKHPEMTRAEVRRDYVPLVRSHVRRADGILCGSQFTASEIRRLLDVPAEKIAVTPYGVDPIYRAEVAPGAVDAVLKRRGLPRRAILFVGSDEKRKNVVNLAMAYMGLARRRAALPPLVLVGPGSGWAQGGTVVGPQIRALGYLDVRELRALMAASAMLVLPSLEEGFGLPVAEAMAAGLPVVCSRGSALEEVAGGAAVLVDPLDTGDIADGIERVLDDARLAESLRQRGLERSRGFRWEATAAQTIEFYRRLTGASAAA